MEKEFYDKLKNWDFRQIKMEDERLTNWELYEELKKYTNANFKILDLGTGGGEKLLKNFPKVKEILGTDISEEMIKTANQNLKESGRCDVRFEVMDNLKMTTKDEYFDIVVARNTCVDAKQIYKTLKKNGRVILHDVDKLDCWNLKMLFGYGQGFNDKKSIAQIELEKLISAGFKRVELIPLPVKEYYKTKEDLLSLLYKTPILNENYETEFLIDEEVLERYIEEYSTSKGILLMRQYCAIIGEK